MKYKVVGSLTSLCLGLLMASAATAGWGHRGGYSSGYGSSGGYSAAYASSGGYTAGYGSSGGYGYSSSYGSSGGYGYSSSYGSSGGYSYAASYASSGGSSGYYHAGPLKRMATAIHNHMAAKHARHAARRASSYYSSGGSSYGSSGGYTASYGSSGGSSGGYTSYYRSYSSGSSGGSVSYGSTGGAVSYGANYGTASGAYFGSPDVYYGASKTAAPSSVLLASSSQLQGDSVSLTVAVPSDAKIFVNGNPTTSKGAVRQFVSKGLIPGKDYRFQLRAELEAADGTTLTEEKELVVTAGGVEHVQFAFSEGNAAVETAVTLNVPEGAQVRLAGSNTNITGSERTYRTSRMKVGEVWDDYEIEVTLDGQTKRQSIRLIAGDRLQLTFKFDPAADLIASR